MSEDSINARLAQLESLNRQLHQAVTGLLLTTCLFLSVWNIFQALSIPKFGTIYDQMLNGKQLPDLSQLVLNNPTALNLLALAAPLAAIIIFITQGRRTSGIWLLLGLALLIGSQAFFTRMALWIPLHSIINEMSSG